MQCVQAMLAPLLTPKGDEYALPSRCIAPVPQTTIEESCCPATHYADECAIKESSFADRCRTQCCASPPGLVHLIPVCICKALLLCHAASLGKDVSRLWDMASGKGHSADRMIKPAASEHDSPSWKRAGEDTSHHAQQ